MGAEPEGGDGFHFFHRNRTSPDLLHALLSRPRGLIISILCGNEAVNIAAIANMIKIFVAHLHHIPEEGEYIIDSGYRFTVVEASSQSVIRVKAEPEI